MASVNGPLVSVCKHDLKIIACLILSVDHDVTSLLFKKSSAQFLKTRLTSAFNIFQFSFISYLQVCRYFSFFH